MAPPSRAPPCRGRARCRSASRAPSDRSRRRSLRRHRGPGPAEKDVVRDRLLVAGLAHMPILPERLACLHPVVLEPLDARSLLDLAMLRSIFPRLERLAALESNDSDRLSVLRRVGLVGD